MFLSQLILNPRSRQVRSELARSYELHRTLMSGFSGYADPGRVLYRLDLSARDGIPRVLLQSQVNPDWSKLRAKEGYFLELPGGNPQMRKYDPELQPGQKLVFRLLANPTRSVMPAGSAPNVRGKRVTIGRTEDQEAWLKHKAENGGFRVLSVMITNLGEQRLKIPGKDREIHDARHWAARFDGELEVTDPQAFRQTLEKGIGSGKGFGYGLLSIAPIR
jgi:CRISPR system Cascade subunit CasE